MLLQDLPKRSRALQAKLGDSFASQRNYWVEGTGFMVDAAAAKLFIDSFGAIRTAFDAAMDYVVTNPSILKSFHFDDDPRVNRGLQLMVKASWLGGQPRDYILDRYDLAWDGQSPPQVLERNFGYLGLTVGTGPVQEDYAHWLSKKKGWRDVRPFASLQEGFVQAVKAVTKAHGHMPHDYVTLVTAQETEDADPGMIRAGKVLEKWFTRAGLVPEVIPAFSLDFYSGECVLSQEVIGGFARAEIPLPTGRTKTSLFHYASIEHIISAPSFYPFYGFDGFARRAALQVTSKKPLPNVNSTCLQPFWTILASHKGLLAYVHQLFPDHPNFLPTFMGTEALQGTPHIIKEVYNCQGIGSSIIEADGSVVGARESVLDKVKVKQRGRRYISQQLALQVFGPDGKSRVFNAFTANGTLAGVGARIAPGLFVGGDDTQTGFVPVLYRSNDGASVARQRTNHNG